MLALRTVQLSKCYRLYQRPVDRLLELIFRTPKHQIFWALKNITFEVRIGETVGIIGDNGAGKSTLLKILAGTLKPTTGEIETQGRIAALLELGAGFHPEFTGRQNIYLNAALLGLSEDEIRKKEKDIIAFSELEEFIDQPVKTYSSGMYVRLAFSIAIQVDPDILIIDEALSVGDQKFQKKSIDRILSFREQGKTVLFCSHSMYHITHLCQRAIWLHKGRIKLIGEARKVVQMYEDYCREKKGEPKNNQNTEEKKSGKGRYVLRIIGPAHVSLNTFDDLEVQAFYEGTPEDKNFCLGFALIRNDEVTIFASSTLYKKLEVPGPKGRFKLKFPKIPLLSGNYRLVLILADDTGNLVLATDTLKITVEKKPMLFGTTFLEHQWQVFLS